MNIVFWRNGPAVDRPGIPFQKLFHKIPNLVGAHTKSLYNSLLHLVEWRHMDYSQRNPYNWTHIAVQMEPIGRPVTYRYRRFPESGESFAGRTAKKEYVRKTQMYNWIF